MSNDLWGHLKQPLVCPSPIKPKLKRTVKHEDKDTSLFRRTLRQALPYRLKIFSFFLLSLLATPLALLTPIPLKIVVDNVVGDQPVPNWLDLVIPNAILESQNNLLVFSIVLFMVIAFLSSLQKLYGENILRTKISQNILLDFRSRLLNHAQKLSIGFHDSNGMGHTSYRIQYDTLAIQNIIFNTLIPLITAVFTFCSMFYVMLLLDQSLALVALVIAPVIFLLTYFYRKPLRKGWRKHKKLDYSSLSIINEVLSMIRIIKAFGREKHEGSRYYQSSTEAIRSRMKVEWLQGSLTLLMGVTTAAGTVVVLYLGALHVINGSLSLGNLLVIMSYLSQLYSPLKSIGSKVAGMQSYLASAERAFSLLEQPAEVPVLPGAKKLKNTAGHIKFDEVSFGYNERKRVLQNISFEVQSGMRVGIAGRTGAGKSTLMNLLFRFYDPEAGRIVLDGHDLRNYKLKDLRDQFSIMLQDSLLFSGTIADNIAYGAPGCSEEEIIHAAKVANAHNFIEQLPEGYQTKVGEKGMKLSGGERQRIALARAFISDASILVLDEPTSSVDTKTETAIVDSLEKVMQGRTTFIIAHRLSTLESCDMLLILENGRIVKNTTNVIETVRDALLSGDLQVDAKGEIVDY